MKSKIYILVSALIIINNSVEAQAYSFSYSSSAYSDLSSPTILVNDASIIFGTELTQSLGFSFNYWGTSYTSVNFSTYGYFNFGATTNYGFYPFYASLKGLGSSHIGYVLDQSGGAGNKILKIEWKTVGFLADGTNSDVASFQIWLYEMASKVEYHFGPSTINSSHYTALFNNPTGVFEAFDEPAGTDYYNLQGNPSMPAFVAHPTSNLFLNGYPPNSIVYTFTPASATAIIEKNLRNDGIIIFPVPANDKLTINLDHLCAKGSTIYNVMNTAGQLIMSGSLTATGNNSVDLSLLKSGIYFLEIRSGETVERKKFIHLSK